jgi:GR25 family glycosyltransferase involved in LPS biosynthesis
MTGRHYGCYLAHRGALETMDTENFDYTLIFEADAFIYTGLEEFVEIVHRACFISERDNVPFISFADNPSREKTKIDELFSKTAFNQDLAHCYLIPNREKHWWLDRIQDCGWDVGDLWFNHVFYNHPRLRYTTNKMYSKQAEGYSLLDLTVKTWNI